MYWASRTSQRTPHPAVQRDDEGGRQRRTSRSPPARCRGSLTDHPDYFPLYTDQGQLEARKEAWTNWCEGFLGGQMWLFYELGLGDDWQARAEHYSKLVEERQYDDQVHDLGFVLCPTWKKWWELTGDDARRAGRHSGWQDHGHPVQHQGQVPALVPGRRIRSSSTS